MLAASCNKAKTDTSVATEQTVAEGKGEKLAVDTVASVVNWKAFHKGGFAPRWGTLNVKSGDLSIEGGQITAGDFIIDMTSIKVDPASVTEADKNLQNLKLT